MRRAIELHDILSWKRIRGCNRSRRCRRTPTRTFSLLASYSAADQKFVRLADDFLKQGDPHARMRAFLDHYLMGKPAPDWMEKGVPLLKLRDELGAASKAEKGSN